MNLARAVRLTRPRLIIAIIAAVLAAVTVLAFSSQAASARPDGPRALHGNGGTKPVIVLVHGAWADASSWDGVIQRLQNDGYTVYAPPNPLRGLPQDSASLILSYRASSGAGRGTGAGSARLGDWVNT